MEENHTLKKIISRQERFYSLEGQYLMDGKKVRGLQFILQDCTDDMIGLLNRRAFENETKKFLENEMSDDLVIILI